MTDDNCKTDIEVSSGGGVPEVGAEADGGITPLEDVLEALSHPTRRFVLYYLQDQEIVTIDELSLQVTAWEMDVPLTDVPPDRREQVATQLTHKHLPKLADSVFLEYDNRSHTVRYADPPALLTKVLRLLSQLE